MSTYYLCSTIQQHMAVFICCYRQLILLKLPTTASTNSARLDFPLNTPLYVRTLTLFSLRFPDVVRQFPVVPMLESVSMIIPEFLERALDTYYVELLLDTVVTNFRLVVHHFCVAHLVHRAIAFNSVVT